MEREKDKVETDKRKEAERIEREKRKEEERIESEKRKEAERIEREKRKEEERKRREEEARILAERQAAEKAAFRKEFGQIVDDNITTVKVTFFEKRADKKYWFTVEVFRTSGNKVVYRTYQASCSSFHFFLNLFYIFDLPLPLLSKTNAGFL